MDAYGLSMEMALIIMRRKKEKPKSYRLYWSQCAKDDSKNMNPSPTYSSWDMLAEEGKDVDAPSPISLEVRAPEDIGAIEFVRCLVEQHNQIFTDANETILEVNKLYKYSNLIPRLMKIIVIRNLETPLS